MCFQFFKDMSGGDDSDASVVPVGNSTDNANAEDSSHPSDGNDSTQKAPNDTDSKEKSIWQNDLGEELYWILIQCLSIFHPKGDQVETDESTRPQMENFYRNKENKRNFHISKNTKKWKYEFCVDDNDVVQKFDDGLPKLIINRKSDTTPENASHKVGNNHKKVVVPIEKVPAVLRSIHNNIDVAGRLQSCNSGGQAKLLKAFNKNYHFYGIRKCVEEFLSSCPTCQATMQLPQMKAPPIPIRTHFPHQRLQMDLIQMASKKKQHMILNPWRFSYILSVKCCFSKYGWLFPLRNKKIDGVYLAVKFLCEKEGFPEYMQSDNGKEFVGNIIKEFFKSREVKIKHGRPRHPQSQGQVENLNKTVKQQLRRILCVLPGKEEQGKLWPLLLPGIASNYNNMYHHTINDVPFRVYHNREPGQLKHCVAPEDYDWCMQAGIKSKTSGESDEHSDEEDEDDDEEEDIPEEEVPPVSSEEQMMSLSDLLQSCASASLSSDFLSQRQNQQIESNFDDTDLSSTDDFETVNFQSCLYSLAKNSEWLRYSALENTEYTIHRNFKQSMKSHKNSIFKIGQRVLFRNPDLNKYTYKTFSFDKLNIVGTVKEVSGHMYKVEVQEGESKCVKSVFKGEMVPLADGDEGNGEEDENDHSNNNNNFSLTSVLNSITDVGAKTRESIYNHSTRFRNKQMTDVCSYMSRYFSALDKELSAKLATDPVLADQLSSESNSIIHDLRKHGFGFFMYGSWAWENSRKDILPTHIIDFVKDQHPSFMADHQCVDCFQSTDSCSHECCFFMAKDFAERTGLQVIKKKAPKENTTNKEPEDGDEQIDGSSTQTKRNSRKRKQDDPMTKKRKKSKPTKTSSAAAKKLNTQKQKNEATNKTRGPALPISAFSVSLVQPQPTLNQPQGIPKQTQFKGVPVVTYKPPTTSSNQTILPLGVPVVTYKPPTTSSNQTILPLGVPVVTYKPPTTSSNQTILPLGLNSVPHHNSNVPSTRTVLPKGLIDSLAHHKSTVPSTSTILPKGLIDSLAHHKSTVPSTSTILPEGLNSVPRHKSNVSSTRTVLPKGLNSVPHHNSNVPSTRTVLPKGLSSVPHHKSTVPSTSTILPKGLNSVPYHKSNVSSTRTVLPKGVPVVTYKPPTTSSNQTILTLGLNSVPHHNSNVPSTRTVLPKGLSSVPHHKSTVPSTSTILPKGLNSVPHHKSNVSSTRTVLPKGVPVVTYKPPTTSSNQTILTLGLNSVPHHNSNVPSTRTVLPKGLNSVLHHNSNVPSTRTVLPKGLNSVPHHNSNVPSTRTVLPKGVPVFTYKPLITSSASKVSSKGLNSVPHHKSTVPSASAILSKDDEAIQKNLGKSRSLKVLLPTMKSEKSSNQHHVFQPKPSSNQTTTLLASSVPTSEAGKNERIDIIGDCNSVTKPIKSVEFSTNNNNMKDSSCKEDEQVCEASEEFQVMTYKNGALEAKYDDKNWSDDPSSSDDDLPTISDALKSQNFHELRDDSSNNNVKTSHLPDLDVPRISSLSQNEKAKIILTDLFGFECAQECLAQNDHVDERHINAFKKQKWVPNSVHRLGLLNIEEFTPFHFNELQNVLASKQSSLCVCDKCHKRLRDSKECINCFKQFHRRCYGPDEICFCCNSIIESEKKIQLEFEKKESEAMERSRSWDQVEHFLKKTMNNGDLALLFKESSDPVKNVLLSLDGLEKGSRYASNMKSLLMENPEFKKLFDQSQHAEDSIDKNGLMTAFIMKHFPVGIGSTGFAKIQFMKMKLIDKFLTPINAEDHVGEN
ncbi:uncharacterized protein [Clytia hemisphaerica]|uniref:uncharacterized protein isoform X2 n=1 Tax=Clytia hemisphaerica TaxID=252671 RepID=UPI0034D77DA2